MSPKERAELINQRLEAAFQPSTLVITDESHLHVGHAGAQGGASHFAIVITSPAFTGLPLIKQHHLIYEVLVDLIPHEIHALRIKSGSND